MLPLFIIVVCWISLLWIRLVFFGFHQLVSEPFEISPEEPFGHLFIHSLLGIHGRPLILLSFCLSLNHILYWHRCKELWKIFYNLLIHTHFSCLLKLETLHALQHWMSILRLIILLNVLLINRDYICIHIYFSVVGREMIPLFMWPNDVWYPWKSINLTSKHGLMWSIYEGTWHLDRQAMDGATYNYS